MACWWIKKQAPMRRLRTRGSEGTTVANQPRRAIDSIRPGGGKGGGRSKAFQLQSDGWRRYGTLPALGTHKGAT